jgi:hypothetical protein
MLPDRKVSTLSWGRSESGPAGRLPSHGCCSGLRSAEVSEETYNRGRRTLLKSKRGLQSPEKREIFLLLEGSVLLPDAGNVGAQGSAATTARSAGCPGQRQEGAEGKRPMRGDQPPHTQHLLLVS